MIIKKKILKDIELKTKKINIQEMIENKSEFDGITYLVHQENEKDFFLCLSHKKEKIEEGTNETSNDDTDTDNLDIHHDDGLLGNFDFSSGIEPQKDDLFHNNVNYKWFLTGNILIANDGIIHELVDHKKEIDDDDLLRSLSIKECFLKKQLESHNFEVKKLNNDEAKRKYNDSLLETLFYPEKIEISLKEIFNNRNHFPITKIEQSEESVFILQLAKSHILEFKNKENKNQKLIEVINIYENTKELQDFESYFTKIT